METRVQQRALYIISEIFIASSSHDNIWWPSVRIHNILDQQYKESQMIVTEPKLSPDDSRTRDLRTRQDAQNKTQDSKRNQKNQKWSS